MPKLRPILLLALAIPACAAPSAAAEAIVPPGNSAANQYTETFPTSGGERDDESHKGGAVPGKTLGPRNAHRLESKGAEGKAAAKLAAETAPASTAGAGSAASEVTAAGGSGSGNKGGTQGSGANGGSGGGASVASGNSGSAATDAGAPAGHPPGSSGLGEVLGQATGSSDSGTLGLLLPLIILCAAAFSVFYLWRQRQRVV